MMSIPQITPLYLQILETVVTLGIAYVLHLLTKRYFFNAAKAIKINPRTIRPLAKLIIYFIYFVAILIILKVWGVESSISALFASVGFAGLVIGLATKEIIGNFLSGLILLFDKNFSVGDVVEIDGISGKVEDISLRTTTIMTWDGELVVVPNSKVTNEIIKNRSLYKPVIRVKIPVGVAYESDLDKVIKICENVLNSFTEIEKDPKPQVVFDKFGDSSINFEVRFWVNINRVSIPDIKTKVSIKLKEEFEKNGIKIPYPHIEIIKKD